MSTTAEAVLPFTARPIRAALASGAGHNGYELMKQHREDGVELTAAQVHKVRQTVPQKRGTWVPGKEGLVYDGPAV